MKTVEDPPAPPPLKVSGPWYHNNRQIKCSSLLPYAGLGDAPEGVSPGLGEGVHAFFCIVYCWQCVKNHEGLVEVQFSLHGGRQCTAPNELPNAGLGDAPKRRLSSLGGGVHAFSCVVSCWQCVKSHEGLVKVHGFHCIGAAVYHPE